MAVWARSPPAQQFDEQRLNRGQDGMKNDRLTCACNMHFKFAGSIFTKLMMDAGTA